MESKPSDAQVDEYKVTEREATEAVSKLIKFIGEDPNSEHAIDTPKRVVKSFNDLFGGYKMTPQEALSTTFDANGYDQMIILKHIEMYSTCSHHMIPFFGHVHIGYIPGNRMVGLSKLARVVEVFSRRLQVQERLTQQIADSIHDILEAKGTMVVIDSKHLCMCARGIQKQNSSMVTSALHGLFKQEVVRQEFLGLIK